jgi:hypothetical protein
MLEIPHILENELTVGGKFASPTQRPRFTPQKNYFSASGTARVFRRDSPGKAAQWLASPLVKVEGCYD